MNPRRRSPDRRVLGRTRVFADAPDLRRRGMWLVLALPGDGDRRLRPPCPGPGDPGKVACARAAASRTPRSITLHATRGVILDRSGRVLVSNVQVFDVFADPGTGRRRPTGRRSRACSRRSCSRAPRRSCARSTSPTSSTTSQRGHAGRQRQAAGARAQRHRHDPVGADRLQPVVGPGASRLRRTCSASSNAEGAGQYGLEGYYNSILAGVNGHEVDADRRQRQRHRPRRAAEGCCPQWR